MDYGRNLLEKYGWKDGQGLGKNETGVSKPIKCGLKFDKAGIGYNEKISKEENNPWWIQMFNKASANISTDRGKTPSNAHGDESKSGTEGEFFGKNLTDEELFQACGGRTAHKAARHGFKLSGKLKRIHQQEKMIDGFSASCEDVEIRKENKSKRSSLGDIIENEDAEIQPSIPMKEKKKKKKKKKSRRRDESDSVTAVADSSTHVPAAEDCNHATSFFIGDTIDEKDQSNCSTNKKKSKKMKEFVTCPVVTDHTFLDEIEQDSDYLRPRKKKRKSVCETSEDIISKISESDISCKKLKRNKKCTTKLSS